MIILLDGNKNEMLNILHTKKYKIFKHTTMVQIKQLLQM